MTSYDFNNLIESRFTFDETLDHLRQAIQSEGLLLLQEINTQQIVSTHGLQINGLRQLLFFHPRYIKAILENNPAAIIEAPLKLIVVEDESRATVVRYAPPTYLFGRYPGLENLGSELQTIVNRLLTAVAS